MSDRLIPALAATILLLASSTTYAACRDTPENRTACTGDALRVCASSLMSGIPAIIACLQQNRAELGADCAAALARCDRPVKPQRFMRPPRKG